jgi:hypothetical protein
MNNFTLLKLIYSRFGSYQKSGYEVRVNCPFCILRGQSPNTTKKLFINIDKKVYNCFRCEARGKLSLLFPQLEAISIAGEGIMNRIEQKDNELEHLPNVKSLDDLTYPWDDLVGEFLSKREGYRWTIKELVEKVYFCEHYNKNDKAIFGPRLIFPIYQLGSYRGFQGRTIYKNTDPKYVGATNMDKKGTLYNYDTAFSQRKRLVIVEGFFDQLRVGDTAVATIGKEVSQTQLRLIRLGSFKEIIVFMDRDAEKKSYEVAQELSRYFSTFVALPTRKDPGEMETEEIEYVLHDKKVRVY